MLNREQEAYLIRKSQDDINAFGLLYEEHFSTVYGFIYKRTHNQALTGELTSLAFMNWDR